MSVEPQLSEEGHKQFEEMIEKFKKGMLKAAENSMADFYVNLAMHIETDAWMNFRNELRQELTKQILSKPFEVCTENSQWAKEVRHLIFSEHKEILMQGLICDLVREMSELGSKIERLESKLRGDDHEY